MSTNQYTPDELAFLDRTASEFIKLLFTTEKSGTWEFLIVAAWNLATTSLRERRKIRDAAQPTQATPIANDELTAHKFVCNANEIRGAVVLDRALIAFNGSTMGFDRIPAHFALAPGDIIEIRVLERADL